MYILCACTWAHRWGDQRSAATGYYIGHGRQRATLPHLFQIDWYFRGHGGATQIFLEGTNYIVGIGSGGYNNCLIDSFRQCLGFESDVQAVRDDLCRGYGKATAILFTGTLLP